MMKLRIFLFEAFSFFAIAGVTAEEGWMSLPKGDLFSEVNEARIYDGKLFLATNKGIFTRPLQEGQDTWECVGFSGMDIIGFAKCGDSLLAVNRTKEPISSRVGYQRFLASSIGSSTSIDLTPDDVAQNNSLWNIHIWQLYDSEPEHLYLTYCNSMMGEKPCIMLETNDFSQSWTKTGACDWYAAYEGSFVVEPSSPQNILIYGYNPYVDCICPYLLETKDGFQTLENLPFEPAHNFLFTDITVCPTDNNQLLAATVEGIIMSDDHGANWTMKCHSSSSDDIFDSFSGSLGYRSVSFDPLQPSVVYATFCRQVNNNYYVDIYRSSNSGDSWQVISTSPAMSSTMKAAILYGSLMIIVSIKGEVACFDLTSLPTSALTPSSSVSGLSDMFTLIGTKVNSISRQGIYIKRSAEGKDRKKYVMK